MMQIASLEGMKIMQKCPSVNIMHLNSTELYLVHTTNCKLWVKLVVLQFKVNRLRDQILIFQQISWRSTETTEWQLSIRWETNSNHASLQRLLRVHWVLIVRSLRDQLRSMRDQLWSLRDDLRSLRDQLGPMEITEWQREFTKNVVFVERFVRDYWKTGETAEHSLRDRWVFSESPLPSKTSERLFWTSWKFDGDHGDQGSS